MFVRNSGKLCFATLQDGDGTQLQAMLSLAGVGQEALDEWKADVEPQRTDGSRVGEREAVPELQVADRWIVLLQRYLPGVEEDRSAERAQDQPADAARFSQRRSSRFWKQPA